LLRAAWRFERGLRRRERARERDLLERLREKAQAQANHLRELDASLETVLRRGHKGPSSTSLPAGH
jgi:chorismate mutase